MRNRTENQIMEFIMLRHGATEENREHRYLGRTDVSLSREGMEALRKNGPYPKLGALFSGPMKRCRETAAILYPDLRPGIIEPWTEMDFGRFERKNYAELQGDPEYQAWIDSGGKLPFPGGESREAFLDRCEKGLWQMIDEAAGSRTGEEKGPVGLVVHGGTIMALLSRFYGGDYFDYQVKNGEGYRGILVRQGKKLRIRKLEKMEYEKGQTG